jgi:hypothetical protein
MISGWRIAVASAFALACLACSDPENGPSGEPGIHVVAGANQSDTVLTTFVQALVIDVTTPQGPIEGVIVRFDATLADDVPTLRVAPLAGQSVFSPSTTIATDTRGRASVRIQLGIVAGPAAVQISVPELGYSATATYTVEPGLAFALVVEPQDTVVEVGASFTSRSRVIDRHGNGLNEPVSLIQPSPNLTVSGSRITASGPGRGSVNVRAGSLADVLRVFVGPESGISGLTPTAVLIFEADGTISTNNPLSRAGGPFTADWSPNGQMLVADDFGGGPLRLILPNGQATSLGTPADDWPIYPEFSPDGQWIYYSRSDQGWHIRRMRPDGSEDQAVPSIAGNHAAPTLSPDGTRMAVVNLAPDRIEIFDFGSRTLTEIAAAAHTPAWSPDGSRIAFVNSSTRAIEVINPDGSGRRVVSPTGHRFGLGLDWTQDGLFILAFDSDGEMIVALDPESQTILEYRFTGIGAPAARPR